jgi:hypothetical protein
MSSLTQFACQVHNHLFMNKILGFTRLCEVVAVLHNATVGLETYSYLIVCKR